MAYETTAMEMGGTAMKLLIALLIATIPVVAQGVKAAKPQAQRKVLTMPSPTSVPCPLGSAAGDMGGHMYYCDQGHWKEDVEGETRARKDDEDNDALVAAARTRMLTTKEMDRLIGFAASPQVLLEHSGQVYYDGMDTIYREYDELLAQQARLRAVEKCGGR